MDGAEKVLDRFGVQFDATGAEAVEHHVRVGLAHAPQDELVGLGIALQAHGRVARDEAAQVLGQRILVRAGLGDDGDRQERFGHVPRSYQDWVILCGQCVAGLGAARLGDRADVAGDAVGDLAELSAQW